MAGNTVTKHIEAQPLTFFAKIFSVFTKPMMKAFANETSKDLDDLKAAVERERSGA